jgi:REP element-mobilizing transposase RayT
MPWVLAWAQHCRMEGTHAGHRALRRGRASSAGQTYLLTTVTADRRPWFAQWDAARAACAALHEESRAAGLVLHGWVLMPDHLHLLASLGAGCSLPSAMHRLKSASARAANRAIGRKGRLWARAYHDRALRRDESVIAVARYIIANPIRAGLVRRAGDYPFWDAEWL